MKDTDPDMPAQRWKRPVLSVNLNWQQIIMVATVLGTPGGFALYKSQGAEDTAGAVAGQNTVLTATATHAKATATDTFESWREEQLADRAELARQGKAINGIVDDQAIIKTALALLLPKAARKKLLQKPAATKVEPAPRPPLPATPPAAAATVAPQATPPPDLKGPTP
jgi:hypothetical protein